ncbi:MAG TPA: glycosyltransferase family 39 protein, partial [Galbitalea sp.]
MSVVAQQLGRLAGQPQVTRQRFRVGLAALVFGATAMILDAIGSWTPSLWGDEATSVLSAERPLPSLFRMLGHVDAVHGTFYLALHFWIEVFGASPVSVRFPSAIVGGLAVAGVVYLGAMVGGRRMALAAGAVALILPRFTYMGAESRGYALSAALAVWTTYLLARLVTSGSPGRRWWVLYAVGIALSTYVFLFSILLLPAHLLAVAWIDRRRSIRRWLVAVGAALVVASPVIVYGIAERSQIGFLSARTAATFISSTVSPWFGTAPMAIAGWIVLGGAAALLVVRGRRAPLSPRLRLVVVIGAWLLVPGAILLSVNIVHAVYSSRYLTFCAPAAALLMGWTIAQVRPRAASIVVLVALGALALPNYLAQRTPFAENNSDWSQVAATIAAHASAGDGVLFDEATRPSLRPRLGMRIYPAAYAGLQDIAIKSPWWQTDGWRDSTWALPSITDRLLGMNTVWIVEYKGAGQPADTYDLATMASQGFRVTARYV